MSDIRDKKANALDGTTWEWARAGWWLVHLIGLVAVFWLGSVWWPF